MKLFNMKKLYLRVSLWILISFTLIIIPLSVFLSHQFSNYAMTEINQFTQQNMYRSVENIELILERMKAQSFRIYSDEEVQRFLSLKKHDLRILSNAYERVTNYTLNEPLIHSVYLLNTNTKVIYDSKKGTYDFNVFHDQKIIEMIDKGNYERLRFFNHPVGNKTFLAIITLAKQYDGVVVMLMDVPKTEKHLLQSSQDGKLKIMLTDGSDQLLLGDEISKQYGHQLVASAKEEIGQFELEMNGEPWTINYVNIENAGLKLYHMSKMSAWKGGILKFQRQIILFSLGLLITLFMIVLWKSKKTYQPFSTLAQELEKKLGKGKMDKQVKEDHQILKEGFDYLVNYMEDFKDHKNLIKGEYLRQWILQGEMNNPIKKFVSEETDILSYPYLFIAVIRIERYQVFLENHNLNARKLKKFAIGNIAEHILAENKFSGHAVDLGGDHVVILIGINQIGISDFDIFEKVKQQVGHHLELDVTIGISDPQAIGDNLRVIYDSVYELSTLKFITGEDKIYQETDFEEYRNIIKPVDDTIKDMLIQAIRLGHEEKVSSIVDQMFDHMKKMTYTECKFQLTLIIYSIIRSYSQLTSLNSFSGVQYQLEMFNTLDEVKKWMNAELKQIMANLNQRKSTDRKSELADEILEYVNLHIQDPMLTVDQIAGHLSLSVNYVRQVFKEVQQETLSEYILNQRIEKVTTLLKTTDWLIADISERAGFQTKSNFYTVFKKVVGMTPAEYRQYHQEKQTKAE